MATTSPSPNSSPSAVPPAPSTSSTPTQPNVEPPGSSNTTTQAPPPDVPPAPPRTVSPPPPPTPSPPLAPTQSPPNKQSDPPASPPPPPPSSSNVPPPADPPKPSPSPPPPTPVSDPPASSPPPPVSSPPPPTSSPPPPSDPPQKSPPPPQTPPQTSPPPPKTDPPKSSTPPPEPEPPNSSPPPPALIPPKPSSSPPPPEPPSSSPPPPALEPPSSSPPPSSATPPPPPSSQPTPSAPPPKSLPPPPKVQLSPPPPSDDAPPPTTLFPSPPSNIPSSNDSVPNISPSLNATDNKISTGGVVAISVVAGLIVLSFIAFAVWCIRRKQKKKVLGFGRHVMPSPIPSSPSDSSSFVKAHSSAPLIGSGSGSDFVNSPAGSARGNSRPWFTYDELAKATNGFSSQNLLGEGGFGSVYKGILPDDREVAVKQLKIGGSQGEREFKAEVETISRIHHRHLVSLVGYCISDNQRLLVYEFVSNDTLYFHLHGEGRPVLDWATRVKIAAGAARGIAYLHEDCHPRIIHRDIKSSNILLDNNFEARVSDFGLAKLCLDANTHISTRVMGTFGYVAPEYASSGKLTEKSDVYSYGVVLLELVTGRKAVDTSQPLGDESLVEWARPLMGYSLDNEEFEGLVDPRLDKNYIESELFRLIEIAAACVRHSSAKRPRMGQVVRAFDSMATADLTNGMKVGESETFNSAQQSAEIRLFQRMAFGSQNYSTDFFSDGSGNLV